jgi:hypothetical protein
MRPQVTEPFLLCLRCEPRHRRVCIAEIDSEPVVQPRILLLHRADALNLIAARL